MILTILMTITIKKDLFTNCPGAEDVGVDIFRPKMDGNVLNVDLLCRKENICEVRFDFFFRQIGQSRIQPRS